MAAANSKRNYESCRSIRGSVLQTHNVNTVLLVTCVICFLFAVGYTGLCYGEIMRVCEEHHVMRTQFPSQFMRLFWLFLQWSGIDQTEKDLIHHDVLVLCNEGFFPILLFIVKEKFSKDSYGILCLMKNAVAEKLQVVNLYCKSIIENILIKSLVSYNTLVCICLFLVIGVFLTALTWKLIWGERHLLPNSPFDRSDDKKCDNHFASSRLYSHGGYDTLQRVPISVDVRQESNKSKDGRPKQQYFSYSFFLHWILVMVLLALFLSIPWEFMRLYQKAVSSHAAKVVKVISSVLTQGILHPLEMACLSLGRSLRAFFAEIPAQWQPLIMLLAVAMSMVFLLMICRYRLSIPLFLRFEPRTPVTSPSEGGKSRKMRAYKYHSSSYPNNLSLNDGYDNQCQDSVADKYNLNGSVSSCKSPISFPRYSISPQTDQKYSSPKFAVQSRTALDSGSSTSYNISSRNKHLLSHDERNYAKIKEKTSLPTPGSTNKFQQVEEAPRKKQNKRKK